MEIKLLTSLLRVQRLENGNVLRPRAWKISDARVETRRYAQQSEASELSTRFRLRVCIVKTFVLFLAFGSRDKFFIRRGCRVYVEGGEKATKKIAVQRVRDS